MIPVPMPGLFVPAGDGTAWAAVCPPPCPPPWPQAVPQPAALPPPHAMQPGGSSSSGSSPAVSPRGGRACGSPRSGLKDGRASGLAPAQKVDSILRHFPRSFAQELKVRNNPRWGESHGHAVRERTGPGCTMPLPAGSALARALRLPPATRTCTAPVWGSQRSPSKSISAQACAFAAQARQALTDTCRTPPTTACSPAFLPDRHGHGAARGAVPVALRIHPDERAHQVKCRWG